ncbi:uncharacterized protein LOC124192617 [Daphnia pulex]|uniref:uncharacterized protein LOC124192617 n=1 Tax=Daphnia pulex TaxID=6669 RepID=UPI001EDF985C|nr:uncharacterized protein LOC124192617 [Daphnia pulex]XP_046642051.1 uncharacterized protein LOC124327168 [Daphnia pulicaria]
MKWLSVFFLVFLCASGTEIEPGDPEDIGPDAPQGTAPPTQTSDLPEETKIELSLDARIRQLLEHYKQDDPLGIPGVPIPDPMPIPDFEGDFPAAKIKFSEAELQQLSQFRINYVRTDLKDLKVWIGMTFDTLQVVGRYRMSSWFSTSSGDFNVTLIRVHAEGFAGLVVDSEGLMQATNITFDVGFKDITMKFENLGFFGSLFQGIINSVGTFIFDSIKPLILGQINDQVQTNVNSQMKKLNHILPDSVAPLDMAMAMGRAEIQENGMDPFEIPEYTSILGTGVVVKIFNGTLHGLSTIHRTGDVIFNFENGSLVVGAQAATQRLKGHFNWQLDFKVFAPRGKISLQIDHLDVKIGLSQPVNVQKKPRLEVLQVNLGNIQARSTGTGSVDYLIEFAVNFLINGFRSVVLRTMEKPVTFIIQKELDKIDVEAMIEEQLPKLSELKNDL